jgi:virginiamycin B lyase
MKAFVSWIKELRAKFASICRRWVRPALAWKRLLLGGQGGRRRDKKSLFNRVSLDVEGLEVRWMPATGITEYSIPTASSGVQSIASGSDGNLWFTEQTTNKVAKVTTSGTFTEYTLPTPGRSPGDITAGPDGNLWFTENVIVGFNVTYGIGKITTSGTITEYTFSTNNSLGLAGITAGPDGNLWFVENSNNKVGKITTGGTITEYTVPTNASGPEDIVAGPDGNLWFTENTANKIAKVTTSGSFTEYTVPTINSGPWGCVTRGNLGRLRS